MQNAVSLEEIQQIIKEGLEHAPKHMLPEQVSEKCRVLGLSKCFETWVLHQVDVARATGGFPGEDGRVRIEQGKFPCFYRKVACVLGMKRDPEDDNSFDDPEVLEAFDAFFQDE